MDVVPYLHPLFGDAMEMGNNFKSYGFHACPESWVENKNRFDFSSFVFLNISTQNLNCNS